MCRDFYAALASVMTVLVPESKSQRGLGGSNPHLPPFVGYAQKRWENCGYPL